MVRLMLIFRSRTTTIISIKNNTLRKLANLFRTNFVLLIYSYVSEHLLDDVLPFIYCCRWSSNCAKYSNQRPTQDCTNYRGPQTGTNSNYFIGKSKISNCMKNYRNILRNIVQSILFY